MTALSQPPREQSSEALAALGSIVLGRQPLNRTLRQIAEIAARAVPGTDEASVALMNGDDVRTVVFTGSLAIDLDERQYEAGSGPGLDAAAGAATVVVDVLDPATPDTDFTAACRRRQVTHVVSIGLPVQQQVIGALNLYRRQPDPPDSATLELARTVAAYAAVVVSNAAQYSDAVQLADQMRQAMASRAVIEQAKGILMSRYRLSADAAFAELTRLSQRSNRKLREVAGDLVAGAMNGRSPDRSG